MTPHRALSWGLWVVLTCGFAGCKQGRGDRCQVDDDCGSGLICNQATNTCQDVGGGGDIDATVPDASPDAPVDAARDTPKSHD